MFGIDAIAGIAGGLLGGDKGGGGGPVKQSQDGNKLSSGGTFNVGGGSVPGWLWPVLLVVGGLAALFMWQPWKKAA